MEPGPYRAWRVRALHPGASEVAFFPANYPAVQVRMRAGLDPPTPCYAGRRIAMLAVWPWT